MGTDLHKVSVDLSLMEQKLKKPPRLQQSSAGRPGCSIFRIPPILKEINHKAYHPQIVSIGPYHHAGDHLQMMEEHEGRILRGFLARTGNGLDSVLRAVASVELRIRDSYSEFIGFDSHELINMMVLDGVFLLEVLCMVDRLVPIDQDDPIFSVPWIFPFLMRDLLRLENQIPFFVLQMLFSISSPFENGKDGSLALVALRFFNYGMPRPDSVMEWYVGFEAKHFLDLFRLSLIPRNYENFETVRKRSHPIELIPSSEKLCRAGIKLELRRMADSFLDVKFRNGVLEIPAITIDDFTTCVLFNCIALEQCSRSCSMHITDYAALMGCIIATPRNADFLSELKIIENYIGSDEEMAGFFNNIIRDVALDVERSSFGVLFDDVNRYCRKSWWARSAALKHAYFSNPWSLLAAWAASLLLLLTAIQTWCAVRGYENPPT